MAIGAVGAIAAALAAVAGGALGLGLGFALARARGRAAGPSQQAAVRDPTQPDTDPSAYILQRALDHMAEGISVVDEDLRLVAWNLRYREIMGLPKDLLYPGLPIAEAIRHSYQEGILHTADRAAAEAGLEDRLARIKAANGSPQIDHLADGRWIAIVRRPLPDGGYVNTFADITERMEAQEALRLSEERYALAAQASSEGLWDWDLTSDRVYYSSRWLAILGLTSDQVEGVPDDWFQRVHDHDVDTLRATLDDYLADRTDQFQAQFRMLHREGSYIWVSVAAVAVWPKGVLDKPTRLVGSMSDISESKRAEEKLIHDALYDAITGLPNRALFLDRIAQMLSRRPYQEPFGEESEGFAVLFLDLDRFKVINDSLGHEVGDELLIDVARRLESALKPGDSLARLASDEFGILLTGITTEEDAIEAVHWLQSDLAAAFYLHEQEVFTSVCIGIALPSAGFPRAEDMLRAADIAMYRAKDKGQSSYMLFDPSMQIRAITLLQLESDLRRAVERDEILVLYQPIISLKTGRIAGFETLARWRHPDRGLVQPADFIPLAEDNGLIAAIGAQALRKSCRQMKRWMESYGEDAPATISVNLSGRQLQDPDLVRDIELMLAQSGTPGSRLKLEVTESMIMRNPETVARSLAELKDLGVSLSIDDFGTGYSSLSYLHRFPFDTLKIDRSFVAALDDRRENQEIIRTIALLAHALGKDVIAEGVESADQLARLDALGIEYAQGFIFSHPLEVEGAEVLLGERRRWDVPATMRTGGHAAE